ncbi:MAG TPA: hypothetical protein VH142_13225 [Polyangiaceae bacterium]|jgi:hypothetical protein|nr:hypothetical protein [Polyangiaceae bacterium]
MNQAAHTESTPPPVAGPWERAAAREHAVDEALEAASTIATFTREIDYRLETSVELLTSIDVSLRELLALAKGKNK